MANCISFAPITFSRIRPINMYIYIFNIYIYIYLLNIYKKHSDMSSLLLIKGINYQLCWCVRDRNISYNTQRIQDMLVEHILYVKSKIGIFQR